LTERQAVEAPKRQFDWFKSWYPVAILEDLDLALPMHTQLLGMGLAIWWDSNAKQWRCARLE
jgi:phenylpropionate dioxygenase-like ring-hydroxylating dioxygenase large terminal subunit